MEEGECGGNGGGGVGIGKEVDDGWCAPKFLVRPKKGPTMLKSGNSWNLVPLPASSTKGGERGVLKAPGLD
jgi:hypothetical protein